MTNSIKRAVTQPAFLAGVMMLSLAALPALSQGSPMSNSFFGTMPGTTGPNPAPEDPPGYNAPKLPAGGGDYTVDEKRMQKKYKSKISSAHKLVSQGESMMKGKSPDSAEYKKGKIKKEIVEKTLSDLKANSPVPDPPPKKSIKDEK